MIQIKQRMIHVVTKNKAEDIRDKIFTSLLDLYSPGDRPFFTDEELRSLLLDTLSYYYELGDIEQYNALVNPISSPEKQYVLVNPKTETIVVTFKETSALVRTKIVFHIIETDD